MKSPATWKVDPSILVSTLSACAVLVTLGASRSLAPTIGLVVKAGWLYLSNTR